LKRFTTPLAALPALFYSIHAAAIQPLFDAHLHYNAEYTGRYSPSRIVSILRENAVSHAVVTSNPPELVRSLHKADPELIIPILGVYQSYEDKQTWTSDRLLPAKVKHMLSQGAWRGVGELHVFAEQRHSEVLLAIVDMAVKYDLPLLMHCDPAVLDSMFEHSPGAQVIWAHAGAYPYPQLLRDYLERYPRLYIDLSVRNERIAPDGRLDHEWETLLWEYPDRFMVGVDTYSAGRWEEYEAVAADIRIWLSQLPAEISVKIAHDNAANIFKSTR
jgi:hypothetical protein